MTTRGGIEEKWIALGEACRALSIGIGGEGKYSTIFTVKARESFLNIGRKFKELLHGKEETNAWDAWNTLEFLSKYSKKSDRGTAYQLVTDTILDDGGI